MTPPRTRDPGAEGRTRTDTGVAPQQFLRLPRLPFRHFGFHHSFARCGEVLAVLARAPLLALRPGSSSVLCSGCSRLPRTWCRGVESNHRHADFQSAALPPELPRHQRYFRFSSFECQATCSRRLARDAWASEPCHGPQDICRLTSRPTPPVSGHCQEP